MLNHVQNILKQEKKIIVSQSLSVEKNRLTLGTLISALFCDLRREKKSKIPSQPEQRERELRDLIGGKKNPVALFVDEAQELVKSVLAYDLNSTEAQLVRQGYDARILADALNIKSNEVRGFIRGELSSIRRDDIMSAVKGLGVVL